MVMENLPKVDLSRAVSNKGDRSAIMRMMQKASSGKAITVCFIGGSITQGSVAGRPENCYAYKVFEWFKESFPSSEVRYVNAGIGATDSQYAAARAGRDLLEKDPDIVFVEFSVNDQATEHYHETYEGLIRKILKCKSEPAVMLIHNVRYDDGGNAEMIHAKVARHYDLPSVSMQQVIYPELVAGRLENRLITPDDLHPNDLGHSLVASVIIHVLEEIKDMSAGTQGEEEAADKRTNAYGKETEADGKEMNAYGGGKKALRILPAPETQNSYEDSVLYNASNADDIGLVLDGFETDHEHKAGITDLFKDGWHASKLHSSIEFKVTGSCISLLYRKAAYRRSPYVEVLLDDNSEVNGFLNGMFDETWGDKMEIHNILEHGECREHKVVIWIYDDGIVDEEDKNKQVPFYISGIIVSGRQ